MIDGRAYNKALKKGREELKQRHKESSKVLDIAIAKEEQRAKLHEVIAEAINDANNTKRFSNSDLMDIQEIITERLIQNGLMDSEEEDKFNRTVQIWACNDKGRWVNRGC
jgi:hypothetical protein